MNQRIAFAALALLVSCSEAEQRQTFRSPQGDQAVQLAHESCGAGCNAKDTLTLHFTALGGKVSEERIATMQGAAKIEIGWATPERLVIGACNAGGATITSDIIRLDRASKPVRTELILTTVEITISDKVYCRGF